MAELSPSQALERYWEQKYREEHPLPITDCGHNRYYDITTMGDFPFRIEVCVFCDHKRKFDTRYEDTPWGQ